MNRLLRTTILIMFGMLIIGIISGCGDDPPEKVVDSPQPEDDVGPASATEVVMDPPPRSHHWWSCVSFLPGHRIHVDV